MPGSWVSAAPRAPLPSSPSRRALAMPLTRQLAQGKGPLCAKLLSTVEERTALLIALDCLNHRNPEVRLWPWHSAGVTSTYLNHVSQGWPLRQQSSTFPYPVCRKTPSVPCLLIHTHTQTHTCMHTPTSHTMPGASLLLWFIHGVEGQDLVCLRG